MIDGTILYLTSENHWLRRFRSKDGKVFHVASRILDGSFDRDILHKLQVDTLAERERNDAGLAFCTAGCKDLPAEWQKLADEYRERNYK